MLSNIVFGILLCFILYMVLSGIRNIIVFKLRKKFIYNNYVLYKKLPSYEYMVWNTFLPLSYNYWIKKLEEK